MAAGPDGAIWVSEYNAGKIARITMAGAVTEFPMPRPNSGPGDITAGADGAMWLVELSGQMDGRTPDGNRIARVAMDGAIKEYPIPSPAPTPINLAVGPDRNVWFTKSGSVGRVTPDGAITEFPLLAPNAGAAGITAGADRQPPKRIASRLWFPESGRNALGYLDFN